MQRCLSTPDRDNVSPMTAVHTNVSRVMTPLLREWARSRLASGSWKDTLTAATDVDIHFFSIACVPDAT